MSRLNYNNPWRGARGGGGGWGGEVQYIEFPLPFTQACRVHQLQLNKHNCLLHVTTKCCNNKLQLAGEKNIEKLLLIYLNSVILSCLSLKLVKTCYKTVFVTLIDDRAARCEQRFRLWSNLRSAGVPFFFGAGRETKNKKASLIAGHLWSRDIISVSQGICIRDKLS